MIVIDQLRQDVFEQYEPAFEHGFRRILDEGYRFTEASHAHARTSTAPGHATLATGVFPSRHAVVANAWQQRRGFQWEQMYAVGDSDSPLTGFENEPLLEGRSPRNMRRETIADWFGAADRGARRVSISKKDRAAIPMGGQNTEHVYWIVPELARFVTSTYYTDAYPRWVHAFNERVMPGIVEPEAWESEVPAVYRNLARGDTAVYEGDGVHTWFPHVSAAENAPDTTRMQHNVWGLDQPRADDAVMQLAAAAIDQLDLGQRDEQDFLAVSLSAADRVGHGYGPFSQEVLSTLLHVDRLLGDLFRLLDEEIGEGRWLVGLSADHGVATMPEYAREKGNEHAERILLDDMRTELSHVLNEAARGGGSPDEIAERVARSAEERGLVSAAYTHYELTRAMPADSFAVLFRNSYFPGRAWSDLSRWGVDLRFGEGDYVGFETGTSHESPYWYDRHVPIMLLGAGVAAGASDAPVFTIDFAPTLAALAGVPIPDDLDGRRIY
jgi:predicted AlkP superfamily pyrophosphatase or phosphodiesterase